MVGPTTHPPISAHEVELMKRIGEADKIRDLAEHVLTENHNTDQDGAHKRDEGGLKLECMKCEYERELAIKLLEYRKAFEE